MCFFMEKGEEIMPRNQLQRKSLQYTDMYFIACMLSMGLF